MAKEHRLDEIIRVIDEHGYLSVSESEQNLAGFGNDYPARPYPIGYTRNASTALTAERLPTARKKPHPK